jgi:hypothetical protein
LEVFLREPNAAFRSEANLPLPPSRFARMAMSLGPRDDPPSGRSEIPLSLSETGSAEG